jgi:hypothetical protein
MVCSDIRSDLSDQETEGCYAMPYKIYGVHTITSLLITLYISHSIFDITFSYIRKTAISPERRHHDYHDRHASHYPAYRGNV